MTNKQLSYVLRGIDITKGRSVRKVDDLESILLENYKTVQKCNNEKYEGYYNYLVLLKNGKKAGIILQMGDIDVHIYMYRKYRNKHIMSRLTNNGFLKKIWSDIDTVTCQNILEYDKIKHLMENAGYRLRNI